MTLGGRPDPYAMRSRWSTRGAITDVATTHDRQVLPGIHTRLLRRGLLPAEPLGDSCHTLPPGPSGPGCPAARSHRHQTTAGKPDRQHRRGEGLAREDIHIDYDRQQVTCP